MYRKICYIKYDWKIRFIFLFVVLVGIDYVLWEKILVEMDIELYVIILINIGVIRFEKKDNWGKKFGSVFF